MAATRDGRLGGRMHCSAPISPSRQRIAGGDIDVSCQRIRVSSESLGAEATSLGSRHPRATAHYEDLRLSVWSRRALDRGARFRSLSHPTIVGRVAHCGGMVAALVCGADCHAYRCISCCVRRALAERRPWWPTARSGMVSPLYSPISAWTRAEAPI